MATSLDSRAAGYGLVYRTFDSPPMQRIRREAYGEDIGQHSWVTADELRIDVRRLGLTPNSHLLDLGCGPAGPLTFILAAVACRGTGLDALPEAIAAGYARAAALGVAHRFSAQPADLNDPLPFAAGTFDTAISLDVVLHLQDRHRFFTEVGRVLGPRGRLLFTDAGVITGPLTNDEVRTRGLHGFVQLVPAGWNERALESAGFRLLEVEDRTAALATVAARRLAAMRAHRAELAAISSDAEVANQLEYLEVVAELARRRSLSRFGYLAERDARRPSPDASPG